MIPLLGHVKWFSEEASLSIIPNLSAAEWLVVILSIIAGVALMFLLAKLTIKPSKSLDDTLKHLRDWVPTAVRWSTAALLIVNYWQGQLYASNIEYDASTLASLLNAGLVAVAIMLLLGVYTRIAAIALLVFYSVSFLVVSDPVQLLDHVGYVGTGLYLALSAPGKLSVAMKNDDPLSSRFKRFDYLALSLLRTFIGLGFIVLAFSEKLLNMALANNFIVEHSSWNFLSSFGLSDRNFIIMTAVVEILIGLSLILNKMPRLSTLVLLMTMVVTATLLGIEEITGHLFAVGLVFAVWVGPNVSLWSKKQ